MSIQTIIDSAQSIEIDRRKVVGQTISRSERIKSAERASANAFKIIVTPPARFRYNAYRSVIEEIQNNDRFNEQEINLANNRNNFITEYQGALSAAQLSTMTITAFSGTSVTFGNLPSVVSATVVLKAGDWIQPAQSRYPYIVTETVTRGTGSLVTATVHRQLITSENTTTTGTFAVGTGTTLQVVVSELPTYKLVQRNWGEFTGDFTLVEKII